MTQAASTKAKASTSGTTTKKESDMTDAKTTAKKTTTRKPAAKKTATTKTRKVRKAAAPMGQDIRVIAAAVIGQFNEATLASESLGVVNSNSRELKGARSGIMAAVKLDDGRRITLTIAVR